MKLVVGLGNPGKEYDNTRHNVGFSVLDNYLGNVLYKEKNTYSYYEKNINGEKVVFLKPITYMNESGKAIKEFIDYYKVDIDDVLVIYDDMDFQLGTFKIKKSGSAAGHNGIKSIISMLGTDNFKRIRVGISKAKYDIVDYVLGKFSKEEQEILKDVYLKLNLVIEDYFKIDFEKLMNKYN